VLGRERGTGKVRVERARLRRVGYDPVDTE
jgi:hypothetical protein